ncbi:hypothetical protein [Arthrobacter sp. GMC3]|uniref:hypothetical protein n=1 Tax=Arthrobacter sp. GMC3 TaxID=2058894 RepID=UPI0015E407D4|nr:hypothetical protein [Arthrobacter sp. GMC3]
MFETEKSAMGANGQIQFGTVFGGSAKVAVLAALPGAVSEELLDPEPLFDEQPVRAKNATARIPNNRKICFRLPP